MYVFALLSLTITPEWALKMSEWLVKDDRHTIQDGPGYIFISNDESLLSDVPESVIDAGTGSAFAGASLLQDDQSVCPFARHEGHATNNP
jgi:hypothetical protein